jgi:hypothetical protein
LIGLLAECALAGRSNLDLIAGQVCLLTPSRRTTSSSDASEMIILAIAVSRSRR